ncbi:Putative transcription elongation factor SPT5 homolog [Seminavis robusta]|uniref:Transcription elongation factor SPT5 n=1 Tax=Seminavis robusta TaxID=568900 RepID=A0A9N8DDT2_9STRA|nr:Putative transcription elongation factor SPT5 homolog [Seminavis robusta]|eukprot:Sro43_g025920.1 Putative transcription elongation factor SPT5 homolog (1058) ;mRNA; r:12250-15797
MSARGGKAFRPGKFLRPQEYSDDEDDEDDEDSDDEESNLKPAKKASAKLSSSEDEDDEEEEEEEEEERSSKKRKASGSSGKEKKRPKASSFFDEEAEASEDDEDEDDPYGTHHDPDDIVKKHYTEEDIQRENMDDAAMELMRQQDRRRAQAGRFGETELSVAEMAEEIENRHRMQNRRVPRADFLEQGNNDDAGVPQFSPAVAQQSLVPSVSDPSLWMVSCATGKEMELVFQIMNKCAAFARQGRPLGISAAVAAQSKGRIYIESFSEPAVLEAIQGVRGLMQYSMRLVPIGDMTTVMAVVSKKKMVKKNDWVRMCRGHYKGDLALVRAVRESGLKAIVQCVPRLDLSLAEMSPEEARRRRRTHKPAQKFFNAQEVQALGKHTLKRQRFPGLDTSCDYFEGNYYDGGYLVKEVTVGQMVKPCTDEDPPSLDELQSFRRRDKMKSVDDDKDENEGSKMAASLLDELSDLQGKTSLGSGGAKGAGLMIGDTVEVVEGDLVGMRGKLVSLDEAGSTVKVKPNNAADLDLTQEVEFLANQVRKYIPVGAHVKVTDGRYSNETGVVVAIEQLDSETDFTAVVLTDVTNKEISVRTSQLRESAEVASGQDKLQGYELYDLVVLSGGGSANEVGVIVRVGREDFTVINNHGIPREVRPEELRGKRNSTSMRAVALDVQGNQLRVGDTVNVAEGPHKGKSATIKRMSRSQLFLYSQTRSEHAGIFVVRSRSCVLAGSRTQNRGGPGDGGMSPFATPQSQNRGGPASRGKRDDGLIGKTVRIQAGQWKGYLGTVCDATATHVQVELHSRLKKVMVLRERVAVAGDKFGATEDQNRDIPAVANIMAPTTPFVAGGATPMHGGATPLHGGATPAHDGGGDDVWRPGGGVDRDNEEENGTSNDDGWGTSNNDDNDDGWGSNANSNSGWGSTEKQDDNEQSKPASASVAIKRDETSEMEDGDANETPVWFMERVCVQLKNGDSTAVIKEVSSDNTAMVVLADKSTKTVRVGEVSMIPPKEHDMVLVTGGADVGVEGELVCIDGTDAILKDSNEDFKIVDFVCLAKIDADS